MGGGADGSYMCCSAERWIGTACSLYVGRRSASWNHVCRAMQLGASVNMVAQSLFAHGQACTIMKPWTAPGRPKRLRTSACVIVPISVISHVHDKLDKVVVLYKLAERTMKRHSSGRGGMMWRPLPPVMVPIAAHCKHTCSRVQDAARVWPP